MGYDIKFRQIVMSYMDEGNSFRKTAELFKVSTSTLREWKSKLKETGTLKPKQLQRKWKKIDPEKLQSYIDANPDAYQHEMAEEFKVSLRAIQKALTRLQITRKKNHTIQRNKHLCEGSVS
jgi:transposase